MQSAQSTTVRDVNGLYLDQEGMQILLFRKALFYLSKSPSGTAVDRLLALGISFRSELLGGFQSRVFDVTPNPPDNCQYADDSD